MKYRWLSLVSILALAFFWVSEIGGLAGERFLRTSPTVDERFRPLKGNYAPGEPIGSGPSKRRPEINRRV